MRTIGMRPMIGRRLFGDGESPEDLHTYSMRWMTGDGLESLDSLEKASALQAFGVLKPCWSERTWFERSQCQVADLTAVRGRE